jgi:hypothetical protein
MPYIGNPIYQSAFVTDQFSGTGSATAFTMSVAPAGVSNVLVAISGVLQDPSTYGVAGTTLTFSTAPPSGTGNISCRYLGVPVTGITTTAYRTVTEFTATAGQTTFTPPSYTPSFINVYLNGVLLGSADYTATNGTTVVLATGAAVGNLVTIESFSVSSVLNAIPNTAGAVSSSNIQTSVALTTPNLGTPSAAVLTNATNLPSSAVLGTTTNNNAAAGYIGEFVSSLVQGVTCGTNSAAASTLTSITLTAGDWDISSLVTNYGAGNAVFANFISTTNNANTSTGTRGLNLTWGLGNTTFGIGSCAIPRYRVSIASTTTYYLLTYGSGSSDQYDGYISARRMR